MTIIVTVDRDLCVGHGQCNAFAPAVYDLDDGYCVLPRADLPAELRGSAEDGADACPAGAITVEAR